MLGIEKKSKKKRKLFESKQPRAASPWTPGSSAVEGREPEKGIRLLLLEQPAPSSEETAVFPFRNKLGAAAPHCRNFVPLRSLSISSPSEHLLPLVLLN